MSLARRDFLKGSMVLSLTPTIPSFLIRATAGPAQKPQKRDTILVALQLTGGNDGLNTLVPYTDDEYVRNRPTLRLSPEAVCKIDSQWAFHPRMSGFMRLYKEGLLGILHGVGYPNQDRSHDRGLRIWHTADPENAARQTGWLGRTADTLAGLQTTKAHASFVGSIARPWALNAERIVVPSYRSANDLVMHRLPGEPRDASAAEPERPLNWADPEDSLLTHIRRCMLEARDNSRRIEELVRDAAATAPYPSFGLAHDLCTIAQLIRADVGIRVFVAELGGGGIGGFDNHANQLGNHCALLHELSESVSAFVDDLQRDRLLGSVLVMTFSEFGRTLSENGRRGTDHGAAAPVFLAGGCLKGGMAGSPPSLVDLDAGALKFSTDFRRVYTTVLNRWLGLVSANVLDTQFEPLDVLSV